MRPTLLQRFFASDWFLRVWTGLGALTALVVAIGFWQPDFNSLTDSWQILLALVILPCSLLAGYALSLFPGCFVLGPLCGVRVSVNGGPFEVGDRVLILAGPHRDRVCRVYSMWQGEQVRVELGEKEKFDFSDVFPQWALLRPGEPNFLGRRQASGFQWSVISCQQTENKSGPGHARGRFRLFHVGHSPARTSNLGHFPSPSVYLRAPPSSP
ncbi:MAG: KOW motif-containing protein, partial [Phycisphaerales bacterium]|nr:KOW motif-containing protein [Phycisphaerales bacterium]